VVAVTDIHPHLRQVTFGGGDLATFAPAGPDTFLYLLLPPPGRTELTIDQSFTWEAYGEMPDADRPVGAYYTVRRWRPERHEVDVLCVLHGDAGPPRPGEVGLPREQVSLVAYWRHPGLPRRPRRGRRLTARGNARMARQTAVRPLARQQPSAPAGHLLRSA
jgi:NADPH-dependent ferric siderophore reductase